jgi:hypothetical protein
VSQHPRKIPISRQKAIPDAAASPFADKVYSPPCAMVAELARAQALHVTRQ